MLLIIIVMLQLLRLIYSQIEGIVTQPIAQCSFQAFVTTYQKTYNQTEYDNRKNIFMENCIKIVIHNSDASSQYQLGITADADLDQQELKQMKGVFTLPPYEINSSLTSSIPSALGLVKAVLADIPGQLDYSSMGLMSTDSKVVDFCNSSWAISAAFLYQYKLLTYSYLQHISQAAIIACTSYYAPNRRSSNCRGGYVEDALLALGLTGGVKESKYPTIDYNFEQALQQGKYPDICLESERIFVGKGTPKVYFNLTTNQIKQLLVQNGPLIVELEVNSDFLRYSEGLFTGCNPALGVSNFVCVLFGYKQEEYWLIRAPLGWSWGYKGTMKLEMNSCGLGRKVSLITYQKVNSNLTQTLNPKAFFNEDSSSSKRGTSSQSHLLLLRVGVLIVFFLLFCLQ